MRGLPADPRRHSPLMAKRPEDRIQTPEDLATLLCAVCPHGRRAPLTGGTLTVSFPAVIAMGVAALFVFISLLGIGAHFVMRPAPIPPPSWSKKAKRYALDFDKDTLVTLPDNLIRDSPALTVEMWFRTDTSGACCLAISTPRTRIGRPWIVPLLYVGQDGILRGAVWAPPSIRSPAARVNDGRWHHAALTADGRTQSLIQDGKLVNTLSGDIDHLTMSKTRSAWLF